MLNGPNTLPRSRRTVLAVLAAVPALCGNAAFAAERGGATARVLSTDSQGVVIALEAPSPTWRLSGGYVYPTIDAFGLLDEPGRPILPVRIQRVGIPAGAQPHLTVLDVKSGAPFAGIVGPVQRWAPLRPGSDEKVPFGTEDPAVYDGDDSYPSLDPVRLGTIGILREQPFVELVFTPVLYDPVRKSSTVFTRVTIRVDFGTVPPREATPEGTSSDAEFEEVYGRALVNATQARAFRGLGHMLDARTQDLERQEPAAFAPVSARYKMIVRKDGIYRLSATWAQTNAPDLLNRPIANLRIDCLGLQVPITVVDANTDGTFNGSDVIEFYGQALTWDILALDDWDSGDYTDDNVYWIYADSAAGLRALAAARAPTDVYPIPADFSETSHHEVNSRFLQQVPQNPVDHWYESFINADGSAASVTYTVATPGVSTTTATASIKVKLVGEMYDKNFHRSTVMVQVLV